MKRSPLRRKATEKRESAPSPPRKVVDRGSGQVERPHASRAGERRKAEPGESEWKRRRTGKCGVCGTQGLLVLHHVVYQQAVRRAASYEQIAAGICWDARNALPVGAPDAWGGRCNCHSLHHSAIRKIEVARLPVAAVEFAVELMGYERATAWLARYYQPYH